MTTKMKLVSKENVNFNDGYSLFDKFENYSFDLNQQQKIEHFIDNTNAAVNIIVFQGFIKPPNDGNYYFLVDATEDADFHIQMDRKDPASWKKVALTLNSKFVLDNAQNIDRSHRLESSVSLKADTYYKFSIRNIRKKENQKHGSYLKIYWNTTSTSVCLNDLDGTFTQQDGMNIGQLKPNVCGYTEIPQSVYYIDSNPNREKNKADLIQQRKNYNDACQSITDQIDNKFKEYIDYMIRTNGFVSKKLNRISYDRDYATNPRLGDICNNNTFYFGFTPSGA